MPDAFDEVFGTATAAPAQGPDAFDEVFGDSSGRADPRIAGVRAHAFGDVPDESKVLATDEDRVALVEKYGMRRKVAPTDFPMEAFGTMANRDRATLDAKQAEFDAPALAEFEKKFGRVVTKADVRRFGDVADVARARATYQQEHPTHPRMPEQFDDPAESRRFMAEAPDRATERAEYLKAGVASPFLALTGARVARAASFGAIDLETMAPEEQRKILAAQAQTATGPEQFATGLAETGATLATVNPFARGLTAALRAAKVSEATAATIGGLLAGSAHGGITEGSVEGAVRTGAYMGGQMGLARAFRGAAPTAGRYLAAEGASGATASAIAQLVSEGHVDPVRVLADGVANTLFGVGGARAAGRAKAAVRDRIEAELRAGRELDVVMAQLRDDADFRAMLRTPDDGQTADPEAMLAELPPDDPMTIGRKERERVKAMLEPVEAPLPQPAGKRAVPADESMVAFVGRMHERSGVGKPGGSDLNRVLRERFGISEEHADLILLRAATEGAIPRDVAEFQGVGLRNRNFRGRGQERVASAEAGNVDDQGRPRWDLFSRETPPPPDDLSARLPFFPGDRVTAPRTVEEALGSSGGQRPVSVDPSGLPDRPTVKGAYRWNGESFVVDPGSPEPMPIPNQPKPKKSKAPPVEKVVEGTPESRMLAEPGVAPSVAQKPVSVAPVGRPGKAAERGAVSLTGAGDATAETIRKGLGRFSQAVRDRGTPSAKELADKLEQAGDVSSREEGPLSQKRRELEQVVIRNMGAAMRVMRNERVPGQDYALGNADEVLAGRKSIDGEGESKIISALDAISQARGKGFENVGTMRTDPKTGETVPFVTPAKILPRVFHAEGMDIMMRGPSDRGWATLVKSVAHANGMPVEAVNRIMTKRREQMIGLQGTSGPELGRTSEAEVFREFEKMPADIWVKTDVGERRVKVLETDPVLYTRRLLATGTARMGVIEAFGGEDKLNDLRKRFLDENTGGGFKADKVWERAMRLAHAIPVRERVISPASPLAPAARAVTETLGLVKEGLMSLRAVSNLPEFLGSPREFAGLGPTLKVMGQDVLRALRHKPMREAVARHIDSLEKKGAITEEGFTGHLDQTRPFSSAARFTKQLMSTVTGGRPIEGKQERDFGRAASMRMDIMKGRKGQDGRTLAGERDVQRLMSLGYDEANSRSLAYGDATDAASDTALRTAQKRVLGANVKGVDLSNLEHSRVGAAMWYSRWANMNIRQGARTVMAAVRGMERAFSEPGISPADRARRVGASAAQVLSWVTGRVASNAAGTFLMSLVTNGTLGAKINVNEAKNDLAGYLVRSFTYGVFGGPYGAIIRNMGQNLSDQGKGVFTPIMVGEEIVNAIQGDDRYTDMSPVERLGAITKRLMPVMKVFNTGLLSGGGVGSRSAAAESGYWRWRRDMEMTSKYDGSVKSNPYQYAMRRTVDALERGDTEKAKAAYKEALSLRQKGQENPADAIRKRLLLTSNKADERRKLLDLLPSLKERIGAEAYEELEKRDQRILDFLDTGGE